MKVLAWFGFIALATPLFLAGCQQGTEKGGAAKGGTPTADKRETDKPDEEEAEIRAARAKLSPEERRLVEAQEFCPVMKDSRLGSMGVPFKVMVNDQPVYLCCKGCRTRALADPAKTLAKVEELKAKSKER